MKSKCILLAFQNILLLKISLIILRKKLYLLKLELILKKSVSIFKQLNSKFSGNIYMRLKLIFLAFQNILLRKISLINLRKKLYLLCD